MNSLRLGEWFWADSPFEKIVQIGAKNVTQLMRKLVLAISEQTCKKLNVAELGHIALCLIECSHLVWSGYVYKIP